MNSRPLPLLLAAALALPSLPASAQDTAKPTPPPPPATPESGQRPSPDRPPQPERAPGGERAPQPGRGGPREERGGPRDERRDDKRDERGGPREERRDDKRDGRGDGPRGEQRHDGPRGPEDGRRDGDGPRRDGDRGPGSKGGPGGPGGPGGFGHERDWNIPLPPPLPPTPTPYLGVVTQPPPPVLGSQLGLKEGFGLVVMDILPNSPAAKAGVQKYDVLTKFNDQQLVDGGQFAILVRGAGKDADATLTFFRASKEQTVPVKVGERMAPQRRPFPGGAEIREHLEKLRGPAQEGLKQMRDRMKEYGDKMRDYQERLQGWQKNPTADLPPPPPAPPIEPENGLYQINPADVLVHAQPGGTRQIRIIQPNGAVSFYTADAKMFLKDESGDVEVTTKEGKRTLVAKDAKGETIFDGPIDSEEQRKSLPEDVRKKIEQIFVRSNATPAVVEQEPLAEADIQ